MSVKGIESQMGTYQGMEMVSPSTSSSNQTTVDSMNRTPRVSSIDNGLKIQDGQGKDKNVDLNLLNKAVHDINVKLKPMRTECQYTYHEKVNRVSIKVINTDTQEVIKEIPPEDNYIALEKFLEVVGLLVDKKL